MKPNLILLVLVFGMGSCVNDNISPTNIDSNSAIVGKWMVKKDSLNFGGDGLNYLKSDSDYYNFQPNGNLIVKEGGVIDSATYSLSPGNFINIAYKKNGWIYFIIKDGIVVKDSIANRFSKKFLLSDLSLHSAKLSALFYWKISRPPMILEGSGGAIDSLRVDMITVLSR